MPIWRNSPSMPKVRDSSARMGTTRGPRSLSRRTWLSTRTKAWVVEISRPSAVGSSTALKASRAGAFSCSSALARRLGR
ncbi:Uncharacterised protein [Bordetella pertussis]|nr:Uncharacterised protein [Bordetella pertussis]CFP63923.1 Uncharacterised protein [Bordetella pertussis]